MSRGGGIEYAYGSKPYELLARVGANPTRGTFALLKIKN